MNIHHTGFFSLAFCPPAFFPFFHPLIHSTKPMYATNLSTHSVTHSRLIAYSVICLAGLAADKAVDYNRSEVTRILQSLQRDPGIIRAGRWPVIDGAGAGCRWQETRFIITFLHHDHLPSPAPPARLWLAGLPRMKVMREWLYTTRCENVGCECGNGL